LPPRSAPTALRAERVQELSREQLFIPIARTLVGDPISADPGYPSSADLADVRVSITGHSIVELVARDSVPTDPGYPSSAGLANVQLRDPTTGAADAFTLVGDSLSSDTCDPDVADPIAKLLPVRLRSNPAGYSELRYPAAHERRSRVFLHPTGSTR